MIITLMPTKMQYEGIGCKLGSYTAIRKTTYFFKIKQLNRERERERDHEDNYT
jgi:hypothetical protein